MNKFNEREKSFEKKFQVDEELKFKVQSRSNKYLAEFVCLKLSKKEEEKSSYIQEVIKADMQESGQEDVFRKIKKDFQLSSISIDDNEIKEMMDKALLRAKKDFE